MFSNPHVIDRMAQYETTPVSRSIFRRIALKFVVNNREPPRDLCACPAISEGKAGALALRIFNER